MSLKLKDFAKSDAGSANLSRAHLEESSDEDISYLPPEKNPSKAGENCKHVSSGSTRRQSEPEQDDLPHYTEVPRLKDEKPWFGPTDSDGSIKVKYPSMIHGYGVDSVQMQQMESMGLPTGFSFSQSQPERQRKGDKKSFYCEICLIDLNSLDTMKSHVAGVKHMKKKLQLDQRREEKYRRGEISEEECRKGPGVIPIPNPVNTKIKVPVRLHEKIKCATEPVVGLDFVREWIAVSDPEMEPYYECELCGNKGIANGMFSHIMGHKHRQQFVEQVYKDNVSEVLDLSQKQLLTYARKHAENGDNLNDKIKTRRSDEEYPWPAGKAPWSIEKGGTGIPPDRARENWGKNDERREEKPAVEREARRSEEGSRGRDSGSSRSQSLPSIYSLKPPSDQKEALQMISIAEKLMEHGLNFLRPKISAEEFRLMKMNTSSILSKLISYGSHQTNGQVSPREPSMSTNSNGHRKRSADSRTPPQSPPQQHSVKRERRSPSFSRSAESKTTYYNHDNRDRGGRFSYHDERSSSQSYRRDGHADGRYREQSNDGFRRRY